jgi:ribA/ribD-fused uncharacterized protein
VSTPVDCRTVDELIRVVSRGRKAKFLFFWSHRAPSKGIISSHCLSQWYPAPFSINGVRYPTAEHYMMAEKARLFGDAEARRRILEARSPGAAKRIGREVRGFDADIWQENRFGIAVKGNTGKFTRNQDLGDYLQKTGRRVLVEASPVDRIWGIGLEDSDPRSSNPGEWQGLNLLGFALMEARSLLETS